MFLAVARALHGFNCLLATLTLALLTACGGSGTDDPSTADLPEGKAARLEVQPAALMLTASGERGALSVRAFDAAGREIAPHVTWRSSRASQVQVDSAGQVQSLVALGATQIVAAVDGVESAPVLVSVVEPAPGVLLVNDSQVIGEPVPADPAAQADPDNAYEVRLTGLALPAVGSLLLGREGKMVGGEVLAAAAEGDAVRVRLRMVSPSRLVQRAQISEVVDLSRQDISVPADVAALYDVKRVDDEFVFTPKPGAVFNLKPTAARMRAQASTGGEGGLRRPLAVVPIDFGGGLKCELLTPELPVSLAQPAQFSLKFEPKLELDYDAQKGLRRLMLTGQLGAKIKASLVLSLAGVLNLACDPRLSDKLVKFPGWVGLILSGELTAGVGFEAEVSAAVPLLGVDIVAESKGPFEVGLDCPDDTCNVVHRYSPVSTVTPTVRVPDSAQLRSEAFLFAYAWAKLKTGATVLENLRADIVHARGGAKFEGSFAPVAVQLAPAAVDYRSDYKLSLLAEVAAGSINSSKGVSNPAEETSAFRRLLQKLGVFKFSTLKTQTSLALGTSPKGALAVDRAAFSDGDTLRFKITMDPATVNFPVVGANVGRLSVLRFVPGRAPREVASGSLGSGQLSLDLSWVAEGTGAEPAGGEFFAFVETVLPTPVKLEMARAQVVPLVMSGQLHLSFSETTTSDTNPDRLSTRVRTLELDSTVELQGARLVMRSPTARSNDTTDRSDRATIDHRGCTWISTTTSHDVTAGRAAPADQVALDFSITGTSWEFTEVSVAMLLDRITRVRTDASGARGDCSNVDLSSTSNESVTPTQTRNFNAPFSGTAFPWFRGTLGAPLGGGASVSIGDSRTDSLNASNGRVQQTGSFSLTLAEGNNQPGSGVNLRLSVTAPERALPEAALTYAVNLVNGGQAAANEVRAEFLLPPGFALVGTTGWSGCQLSGSSVVCQVANLAAGEQRAFLIDVLAPARAGLYTVLARVASAEPDADFADNHGRGQTDIR